MIKVKGEAVRDKLLILNLEDNPNDAELNKEALARAGLECEILCVETREAFSAAIERGGVDIILADYSLPSYDGFSALDLASNRCPEIPFVFVSATPGEEITIEALKRGATDYVLKDGLSRLGQAVLRALKEREDRIERRRAEEALRRSEERQGRLIQQTFDIILETDEFGFIKNISPQSEQLFGAKPEDMNGKHIQDFIKESDRERVAGLFQRALSEGSPGAIEFLGKGKDGQEVHCELKYVLEESGGKIIGFFGVIRDLTEWHKMQAQIQQSLKMEAIGTLAGGIAHDFNNILGAIIGYTQLALYDLPEGSPLRYNLEQVLSASDRAKDLITQILTSV
jgi:PAS domain S-box-containing protein